VHRHLAVRKHRRDRRAWQPALGLERLDSRLALSASVQLVGKWLKLPPPAAIASSATAAPRLAPPTTTGTIAAARIVAAAAAPVVTSVTTSNGGPYGSDTGGYTVTVKGSGFVDSSGLSTVQGVSFYDTTSHSVGGASGTSLSVTGSSASGTITFTMPNLGTLSPLPLATAVVVSGTYGASSTAQVPSNTFTFAQQAQVTSISYAGRSDQPAVNPPDPGLQAQNGPLTGGGTLLINGSGFVAGSSVQFVDYGTPQKTVTVPATSVTFVGAQQLSLTVPNVSNTWSSDTTVAVRVVPPGVQPIPSAGASNNAGGYQNQFTFYRSPSMTFDIKLPPNVVSAGQAAGGIYLVAYSQVGDRTGTLFSGNENMQPVIMRVFPGVSAGKNRGSWEQGTSMLTSVTAAATGTAAAAHKIQTLAIAGTSKLRAGMRVSGTGIPTGTLVKSVDSATQITITEKLTQDITNTDLTFASDYIDASKYGPGLSFGTTPDKNGYLTATVAYENLLYAQGYSNVSAGAVLAIGGFPVMSAPLGKAGSPTVGTNPGLLYGLTELNISGLATTNYSAPSSVVDVSFVDQFGIPLQAAMTPTAPFPLNPIGVAMGTTRQGAVTGFANAVKQSTLPGASGFASLVSASPGGVVNPLQGQASAGTTQILAPFTYLSAVEKFSGIKPATLPLNVKGGTLTPPTPPAIGDSVGYFYWVTAVGDGGGETMAFGTGQTATSPNTDGIFNTTYQALPSGKNAILVSWGATRLPQGLLGPGSIPLNLQATATAYNVYRAPAYSASETVPEPIVPLNIQKLTLPLPGTALSYLDDGNGIWQSVTNLPASNATFSSLSGFFDAALDTFFANYTTANSFEIFRDGVTWKGNTINAGGGSTAFTYVTADGTVHNATAHGRALLLDDTTVHTFQATGIKVALPTPQSLVLAAPDAAKLSLGMLVTGVNIQPGTTVTQINGGVVTISQELSNSITIAEPVTFTSQNQFVWLDPSAGPSTLLQNTWIADRSNLGYSAGYQIFGACGAAGDGGPANVTVNNVNPWADLQNSIAAAFDRGIATNFTIKPDAWANPPQFNAPAKISAQPGTWSQAQVAPHTWAVTGVIGTGAGAVETVYGVLTNITPKQGKAVTLQWSTQPTGSQPYTSFNLYRAKGLPGQSLTFKQVNKQPIPMPASGQTVVFRDTGAATTPTSQPVTYWAPGTVHDVYAAYQHRIAAKGLAYGYAYDDQGGMSSTYTANGNPVSLNGYLSKVTVGGLRWGTVGNPQAKDGTANTQATGIAVAPIPRQIPITPPTDSIFFSVAQTTLSVQVMAKDTKTNAVFPAFGSKNWSVKVVGGPNPLPGMLGKSFAVSYLSGQAQVSLKDASPTPGTTYTVNLQLYNGSTPVGSPQSATFTAS